MANGTLSAGPRLPFELMLRVVEHSRNDVVVLRQLALTSRDLRSQAVRHLFDRVTLSTVYTHHRWTQFVENHPEVSIPHIKVLIIESGRYNPTPTSTDQFWTDSTQHTPGRILDLQPPEIPLPNPPIDSINTLIWSPLQSPNLHNLPAVAHIVSSLGSLRNLHVIRARFTSILQFQRFLSNCRPITFLELHRVLLDDGGTEQIQAGHGVHYDLTHLKEFRVSSTISVDWVVNHILLPSLPTALTTLSIESPSSLSGHAFSRLLDVVAPSLRRLVIAAITVPQQDLSANSLPRTMPQLQDVTIVIPLVDAHLDEPLDWCTSFIEIFPQTNALSYLTLMLDVGTITQLEQEINSFRNQWDQFLQLLFSKIQMSFPRVEEILIDLILDERPMQEGIQEIEPILKGPSNESIRVCIQWETVLDPTRYGHHLPNAMSPTVALALRSRFELAE